MEAGKRKNSQIKKKGFPGFDNPEPKKNSSKEDAGKILEETNKNTKNVDAEELLKGRKSKVKYDDYGEICRGREQGK